MLAEFTVVPLGVGESLSKYVAKSLELIQASGLEYRINPMGTVVEGEWDEVMALIKKCHMRMLEDSKRVSTSIKIDDRKGRTGTLSTKIESVQLKVDFKLKE
jgi:uncharacterized protein (TIGR00106 family)